MTLKEFNILPKTEQRQLLTNCCGSSRWIDEMLNAFPADNQAIINKKADEIWQKCTEKDYLEAFTHHPKIGDIESLKKKFASTAQWASNEQSGTASATEDVLVALKNGNEEYESKFGFIFIVCATGKTATEMLEILQKRLPNNRTEELKIAAAEQHKITHLRLAKLLAP